MNYTNKANYKSGSGESSDLPSKTVQNETMSIKEILQRYSNGEKIQQNKVQYFDQEIDKIDHMFRPSLDLTDLEENKRKLKQKLDDYDKIIKEKEAETTETKNDKNTKKTEVETDDSKVETSDNLNKNSN